MKKNFQRFALLAAATGALLCVCIPPANSIARRPAFPVANEKVYLYPAIDSSLLSRFSGWPSEASLQAPLRTCRCNSGGAKNMGCTNWLTIR
jgi:hypothetical protein